MEGWDQSVLSDFLSFQMKHTAGECSTPPNEDLRLRMNFSGSPPWKEGAPTTRSVRGPYAGAGNRIGSEDDMQGSRSGGKDTFLPFTTVLTSDSQA